MKIKRDWAEQLHHVNAQQTVYCFLQLTEPGKRVKKTQRISKIKVMNIRVKKRLKRGKKTRSCMRNNLNAVFL